LIAYLKGKIVEVGEDYFVVETSGVGYKVRVSFEDEGWQGVVEDQEVEVYTSQYFREDEQGLFGFPTPQERNFYELLRTVSGVGTKLASTILGILDYKEVANMIVKEDVAGIVKVPGIGKKVAEKIIVELKDKVMEYSDGKVESKGISKKWSKETEFIAQALRKLGFSNQEIADMMEGSERLLEDGMKEDEVLTRLLSESAK
jgi:Holliday junction DNA helicase RuvA